MNSYNYEHESNGKYKNDISNQINTDLNLNHSKK